MSFSVNAGEVIGIIGHTGSGKSTLIQQFNGLLRPTSGKVLVNGKDIWEQPKKIRQVRFQVGMVFQYPEYQLFEETVEKDIGFGPRNQKLSEAAVASRVDDAIAFVGLEPSLRKKSPFSLSGGEKRRAAIAGVIAMDPDILVLDEPTAGLDPQGREALMGQIMAYHKQRKNTIILVSHSMEDVAELADRVLVMDKGSVCHVRYGGGGLFSWGRAGTNGLACAADYANYGAVGKEGLPGSTKYFHIGAGGCPITAAAERRRPPWFVTLHWDNM